MSDLYITLRHSLPSMATNQPSNLLLLKFIYFCTPSDISNVTTHLNINQSPYPPANYH